MVGDYTQQPVDPFPHDQPVVANLTQKQIEELMNSKPVTMADYNTPTWDVGEPPKAIPGFLGMQHTEVEFKADNAQGNPPKHMETSDIQQVNRAREKSNLMHKLTVPFP